jgi:hypothetical protein
MNVSYNSFPIVTNSDHELKEYGNEEGIMSHADGFTGKDDIRIITGINKNTHEVISIYITKSHYDPPFTKMEISNKEDLIKAQALGAHGSLVPNHNRDKSVTTRLSPTQTAQITGLKKSEL